MTTGATSLLAQWWTPIAESDEFAGHWIELADRRELKGAIAAIAADHPWMELVQLVTLVEGRPTSELATDLAALRAWEPATSELPEALPDVDLPPRGRRALRHEVVLGCREQLARGVRARMLRRENVGLLLLAIDRAFDRAPVHAPPSLGL